MRLDRPTFGPRQRLFWALLALIFVALVGLSDFSVGRILLAMLASGAMLKIGFVMIGGLARPLPEPPPPGELRKVKIMYRCSVCGTELRMTTAHDEMPDPPRQCQHEMDLVTPLTDGARHQPTTTGGEAVHPTWTSQRFVTAPIPESHRAVMASHPVWRKRPPNARSTPTSFPQPTVGGRRRRRLSETDR